MDRIVVTGGSSGVGAALIEALNDYPFWKAEVHDWSTDNIVDVRDYDTVLDAAMSLDGPVDILVNAAGVNYINWLEQVPESEWDRLMDTNAKGLWLTTKALINAEKFNRPATICNIVSNASHMPMTHSVAYNASKGAAHIMTLQMARELKKTHDITVFGVSPNKMAGTRMSQYIEERVCELRGWTPEQAAEYQKAALPAGEETPPEAVAEFLAFLLSSRDRHKYLNGCVIPYGA
jgi:NAD(P)-dependent dehydrogenase (short-subunit alcohol dehydrogenase family)